MNAPRSDEALRNLLAQAEGLLHRCDWTACLERLDDILGQAGTPGSALWAAEASLLRARLLLERREPDEATRWEARALDAAQQAGDAELALRVQLAGVAVSVSLSAIDAAWQTLEQVRQALARLPAVSDRLQYEFHRARSHAHIPMAHQEEALAEAERSLQAAERLNEPRAMAAAIGNVAGRWYALGYRLQADGRAEAAAHALGRAVELGEQAVAAADAVGSTWLNLANLNNLCGAATALRDARRARSVYTRLEQLSQASGVFLHRVHAGIHMARLLRQEGRPAEALALIDSELPQAEAMGALKAVAVLSLVASQVHEDRGDFARALAAFKRYHGAEQSERGERAEQLSRVSAVREAAEQARAEAEALRAANAALSRQALTDPLTGIANRRGFDAALQSLLAQPHPPGQVVGCLVLLDADHFKQVNDRHSHSVGDQVLRVLAGLLNQHCRQSDLAARWGGEEFAVLLRGADAVHALAVCERLRQTVEQHPWQTLAPGLAVTVSVGLVAVHAGADAEAALQRCDQALYRAKSEGRNRVCRGEPVAP